MEEILIYGPGDRSESFNRGTSPSKKPESHIKTTDSVDRSNKDASVSIISLGQDLTNIHLKYNKIIKRLALPEEQQIKLLSFGDKLFNRLGSETGALEERIDDLEKKLKKEQSSLSKESTASKEMIHIIERKDIELADLRQEFKSMRDVYFEKENSLKSMKFNIEKQLAELTKNHEVQKQQNEEISFKLQNAELKNNDLQKINYDLKTMIEHRDSTIKDLESRMEKEKHVVTIKLESQLAGLKNELLNYEVAIKKMEQSYQQRITEIQLQNDSLQKECLNYKAKIRENDEERMKFELMENGKGFDCDNSVMSGNLSILKKEDLTVQEEDIIVPKSPNISFDIPPNLNKTELSLPPITGSLRRQKTMTDKDTVKPSSKIFTDKVSELECEIASLKQMISDLQSQKFEYAKKVEMLNLEVHKLSSENASLLERIDSVVKANIELDNRIAGMTDGKEISELKKANHNLLEQIVFYKKLNANLERNIADLSTRLKNLIPFQSETELGEAERVNQIQNKDEIQQNNTEKLKIPAQNDSNLNEAENKAFSPLEAKGHADVTQNIQPQSVLSMHDSQQGFTSKQFSGESVLIENLPSQTNPQSDFNQSDLMPRGICHDNSAIDKETNQHEIDFMLHSRSNPESLQSSQVQQKIALQSSVIQLESENKPTPNIPQQFQRISLESEIGKDFATGQQSAHRYQMDTNFYTPNINQQKVNQADKKPSFSENKFNEVGLNLFDKKPSDTDKTPGVSRRNLDFEKFDFNSVSQRAKSNTFTAPNDLDSKRIQNLGSNFGWDNQAPQMIPPIHPSCVIDSSKQSNLFVKTALEGQQYIESDSQVNQSQIGWQVNYAPGQNSQRLIDLSLNQTNQLSSSNLNFYSQNPHLSNQLNNNAQRNDNPDISNQTSQYDLSIFESDFNQQSKKEPNFGRNHSSQNSASKFKDFDFAQVNQGVHRTSTMANNTGGQYKRESFTLTQSANGVPEDTAIGSPSPEQKLKKLENQYQQMINENKSTETQRLQLQLEINSLKYDIAKSKSARKIETDTKPVTRQQSDIGSLNNIFAIDSLPESNPKSSQPSLTDPPLKPLNRSNRNSFVAPILSQHSKNDSESVFENQLKKIAPQLRNIITEIKKDNDKPISEVLVKKYSYDHLAIGKRGANQIYQIIRTVLPHQNLNEMTSWYSENAGRFNARKKKKSKMVVITSEVFFIFNPNKSLKRYFSLKDIIRIIHRRDLNYLSFKLKKGNDEMLEFINKEEVLMFLEQQFKRLKLKMPLTDQLILSYLSTDNAVICFDYSMIKNYKPMWFKTFNYATKHTCLGFARIRVSHLMGLLDQSKTAVLLLTSIAIICFSTVEFNVVDVFPLVGTKLEPTKSNEKFLRLILSDLSEKLIEFNSTLDKNLWNQAITSTLESFKNANN